MYWKDVKQIIHFQGEKSSTVKIIRVLIIYDLPYFYQTAVDGGKRSLGQKKIESLIKTKHQLRL